MGKETELSCNQEAMTMNIMEGRNTATSQGSRDAATPCRGRDAATLCGGRDAAVSKLPTKCFLL